MRVRQNSRQNSATQNRIDSCHTICISTQTQSNLRNNSGVPYLARFKQRVSHSHTKRIGRCAEDTIYLCMQKQSRRGCDTTANNKNIETNPQEKDISRSQRMWPELSGHTQAHIYRIFWGLEDGNDPHSREGRIMHATNSNKEEEEIINRLT